LTLVLTFFLAIFADEQQELAALVVVGAEQVDLESQHADVLC
jgi:hypothetical protein